jgi:hypothetical protein
MVHWVMYVIVVVKGMTISAVGYYEIVQLQHVLHLKKLYHPLLNVVVKMM